MKIVSVVPGFIADHGIDPQIAASMAAFHDGEVIMTTTNGLCGAVVEHLRPYRIGVEPFSLPDGGEAFRVVRSRP